MFIKYEDLVDKKKKTLIKVFKFIKNLGMNNLQLDMNKLNKVIKSTEFQAMQNLEKVEDFQEGVLDLKTKKRKTFFKFGSKNNWKKDLDEKNRKKIEKFFFKEMTELGYL